MECYCYLRNIQDLLSDGKTACERRFEEQRSGPITPCGAKVEYHPIAAKHQARLHQFGKKALPGIFVGCAPHAGEAGKETYLADVEE